MTIEEAKECLEAGLDHELPWDLHEAIKVVLNYLEAFEKAMAKIGSLPLVWEYGQGVEDCLAIIDKHLQEVET